MSPGPTFGPYPTSGVLGSGGMGVVYLARDPKLGRELAIKTLSAGRGADETQRRRFKREARALAELSHPGLVSIVDAGVQDGVPWLAMLRVPGETLESRIRARGRFSSEEACALGIQLCSALAVAHARGILHRDLKPENVLETPDGRYVITDFGLTKDLAGEVSGDLSRTGTLIGTPGYWAPEQAMGQSGQSTPATDVYGLGAVLYAALTGVPPISAPSLPEAVVATQECPPTPPSVLGSVTPALERVVLKCLEKSPTDRYDSVDVLEEALRELSREQGRRAGGRKLLLAAGAGGAFLVGVLGVWLATGQAPPSGPVASGGLEPTPLGTPRPSASAPPRALAEDLEARVRRAIEARAWDEGHQALAEGASLQEIWLRYLLLRAEVEWRGEGTEVWHARKEQADVLAARAAAEADSTPSSTWGEALRALTGLLKDPFLNARPEDLAQHMGWEVALERAWSEGPREEARVQALGQGLVSLALQRAAGGPRGATPAVERARGQLSAWEAAGGTPWKVLFSRARLELRAGTRPLAFVSAVDVLAREAVRLERPWLRSASSYFRAELTLGFARSDQIPFWRSLSRDPNCPRVLRGHSVNCLGALLLEAEQPLEALEVLSRAPTLPAGFDGGVRYDRLLRKAEAQLRCQRPGAALETLASFPRKGPWETRHDLLRGIALAKLGRPEESLASVGRLQGRDPRRRRGLVVEFAALTSKPTEVSAVLRRLLAGANSLEALLCADRVEELLSEPGIAGRDPVPDPEVLRGFVAAVRKEHLARIEEVVGRHLEEGLWALAARRVEQGLGGESAELRARLDYRVLSRALEEVRPSDLRYRLIYRRALTLATRNLDERQPQQLALLTALQSLGEESRRGRVTHLSRGYAARPDWWELYEAADRIYRARRQRPGAPRSLVFGALQNARAWLRARPNDARARLAFASLSPATVARTILTRRRDDEKDQGYRVWPKLVRARVEVGEVAPQEGSDSLSFLGHHRQLLTRSRAEVFLDAAEVRLRAFGEEANALLVLDLLKTWCGEELGDPTRYHLLRARALIGLGRAPEALRSALQAQASAEGASPKGVAPELRGRVLATLGQCEQAAGVAGGAERLEAATELAPCFEVWLAAARSTTGARSESCYAEAFSHLQYSGQIEPLWGEVLAAGLDAPRVGRLALRHFEGRGLSAARFLVSSSLFDRLGDRASALNLCRAVVHFKLLGGAEKEPDRERVGAALARAQALLPPELCAFVQAIVKVLARAGARGEERSATSREELIAALRGLEQTANHIDAQQANDFWLPAVREVSGGVLARSLPVAEVVSLRRKELQWARALRAAKEPSLRLELWIARLEVSLRDPKTIETLAGALAVSKGHGDLRRIVQLERGLVLRRLGRTEEALEAYEDLVYSSEGPRWRVLGLALQAQLWRNRGAEGRKQQRLALSRAECFGGFGVPSNVRSLHFMALAQAHLDQRDVKRAGLALEAVDKELKNDSTPALLSERHLLGATLARLRGEPAKALSLLDQAGRAGGENADGIRRERALILCDLGRRSEAIEELKHELESDEGLWEIERAALRELLQELTQGDR